MDQGREGAPLAATTPTCGTVVAFAPAGEAACERVAERVAAGLLVPVADGVADPESDGLPVPDPDVDWLALPVPVGVGRVDAVPLDDALGVRVRLALGVGGCERDGVSVPLGVPL